MKKDDPNTLSHEYAFNHIFIKLSDTFHKSRLLLPYIEDVERAITESDHDGFFNATINVLAVLKKHAETSEIVTEIFQNGQRDF